MEHRDVRCDPVTLGTTPTGLRSREHTPANHRAIMSLVPLPGSLTRQGGASALFTPHPYCIFHFKRKGPDPSFNSIATSKAGPSHKDL